MARKKTKISNQNNRQQTSNHVGLQGECTQFDKDAPSNSQFGAFSNNVDSKKSTSSSNLLSLRSASSFGSRRGLPGRQSSSLSSTSSQDSLDSLCSQSSNYQTSTTSKQIEIRLRQEATKRQIVDKHSLQSSTRVDAHKEFLKNRVMTPAQELWNAVTMLPSPLACLWYLWNTTQYANNAMLDMETSGAALYTEYSGTSRGTYSWSDSNTSTANGSVCYYSPYSAHDNHSQSALSWTVYGVACAFALHAPASILYHAYFASRLPCVFERTRHWSRKLDHIMIHVASLVISFSLALAHFSSQTKLQDVILTIVYLLFVAVWNAQAIGMHLSTIHCNPQGNQIYVLVSTLLYTLPLWWCLHIGWFLQAWTMLGLGFALFKWYPLGGWSHGMFHLVLVGLPPLLMEAANIMSS
jgi:hypothetical protein